jgi:hypothetical protein
MEHYKLETYPTRSLFRGERWRWRLVAANNKIVAASSEGFVTRDGAVKNAQLTYLGLAQVFTAGSN